MPCEHKLSSLEQSLIESSEKSKKWVGFDGYYSLPTEQRLLIEAKNTGKSAMLVRVIKHLKLSQADAQALYFGLMDEPEPQSIEEIEEFFKQLRSY